MLEDKLKATDWEATNETISEQVARESYLQWLKDNEKRNKVTVQNTEFLCFILQFPAICQAPSSSIPALPALPYLLISALVFNITLFHRSVY